MPRIRLVSSKIITCNFETKPVLASNHAKLAIVTT